MSREKFAKSDIYHLKGSRRGKVPGDEYGQYAQGDLDTGFRHSSAYHSYFEGWTEVQTEDEKGKKHITRVYTAPYIVLDLKNAARRSCRILEVVLWAAIIGLYIFCMTASTGSNRCWYVALPGLLTVICLLLLSVKLFNCLTAPSQMTIFDFKNSSKAFRRYALGSCVLLSLTAVCIMVFAVINQATARDLINAALMLLAGGVAFFLYRREAELPYKETENNNSAPGGGFVIK